MATREFEVIHSDRIDLIREANEFVKFMTDKQTCQYVSDISNPEIVELETLERETYNEALNYLKRQFVMGFKETETVEKLVDKDEDTPA